MNISGIINGEGKDKFSTGEIFVKTEVEMELSDCIDMLCGKMGCGKGGVPWK